MEKEKILKDILVKNPHIKVNLVNQINEISEKLPKDLPRLEDSFGCVPNTDAPIVGYTYVPIDYEAKCE